jgi:hypothetical protein
MNLRNPVRRYGVTALVAMMAAAMPAACDAGGDSGAGGGSAAMTLSVREPAPNATVTMPFTVTFDSSVPLGDEASGRHHVHLYFDDNSNDYLIVESGSVQVTKAPAGVHVMHLSLRNANHSAAGVEAQVMVTIAGAPGPSAPASPSSPSSPAETDGGTYSY